MIFSETTKCSHHLSIIWNWKSSLSIRMNSSIQSFVSGWTNLFSHLTHDKMFKLGSFWKVKQYIAKFSKKNYYTVGVHEMTHFRFDRIHKNMSPQSFFHTLWTVTLKILLSWQLQRLTREILTSFQHHDKDEWISYWAISETFRTNIDQQVQ